MKNNTDKTIDRVREVKEILDKGREEYKEALQVDLIHAIRKMNHNKELIEQVQKKGLPTYILVSSDIFNVSKPVFAQYARVMELQGDYTTKVSMAWDTDYGEGGVNLKKT